MLADLEQAIAQLPAREHAAEAAPLARNWRRFKTAGGAGRSRSARSGRL